MPPPDGSATAGAGRLADHTTRPCRDFQRHLRPAMTQRGWTHQVAITRLNPNSAPSTASSKEILRSTASHHCFRQNSSGKSPPPEPTSPKWLLKAVARESPTYESRPKSPPPNPAPQSRSPLHQPHTPHPAQSAFAQRPPPSPLPRHLGLCSKSPDQNSPTCENPPPPIPTGSFPCLRPSSRRPDRNRPRLNPTPSPATSDSHRERPTPAKSPSPESTQAESAGQIGRLRRPPTDSDSAR